MGGLDARYRRSLAFPGSPEAPRVVALVSAFGLLRISASFGLISVCFRLEFGSGFHLLGFWLDFGSIWLDFGWIWLDLAWISTGFRIDFGLIIALVALAAL